MENRNWITVKSSQINKISYDANDKRLFIEFKNNSQYSYYPVTIGEYINLKNSSSVGQFFHAFIKTKQTTKQKNGNKN